MGNYTSGGQSGFSVNEKDYLSQRTSTPDDYDADVEFTRFGQTGAGDQSTAFESYQNTIRSAEETWVTAQKDFDIMGGEAEASVEAAWLDADARIKEADAALEGVKEQCKTDEKIAEMEYEVEIAKLEVEMESIEKVDAVNAQANLRAADAQYLEAEAEEIEAEAKLEKAENAYYYGDGSIW